MTMVQQLSPAQEHGRFAEVKANEKLHADIQNCKAARTVAEHATNAADCASLLEMLGLDASEGKRRIA
jgi:hypothetical protein